MKLYLAGNGRAAGADQEDYDTGTRNRLLSYAFIEDWADLAFKYWVENNPADASVFLDSGAFSAFTRGATIDLDRYCDYIQQHERALAAYAALDVIGDWRGTAENAERMRKRGLLPLPVFHRGSPWEELDRLCREYPYIALGGMVGGEGQRGTTAADSLSPYLDEAWSVIGRHWPVKVHCFGVIAQWVIERYPFYSADSASAIMGAGMGRVQRHDPYGDGRFVARPWTEDIEETWDGVVADGVGRKGPKSQSAHAGRRRRNIEAQLALEAHVTRVWSERGVRWE